MTRAWETRFFTIELIVLASMSHREHVHVMGYYCEQLRNSAQIGE
jgi:hypothetical protein